MSYRLEVSPEAEEDLAQAFSYYEKLRSSLGREFVTCVDETFERITRSPLSAAIGYKSVRQTLVHRFPYVVCYVLNEQMLSILLFFMAIATLWLGSDELSSCLNQSLDDNFAR